MSSCRRYLLLTTLAVGELLVCTPSFAAAPAPAPGGGTGLSTVVVTARRRAENLQNVPVSVTAISPKEMRVARITTGEDIQFITPGLTVQGGSFNRESSSYTIRGEAPQGVPVYLDEVPIAGIGQDGGAAVALPYWDLDSVQVLKGPQGTLFGGTATGGAVLVTTKKPNDQFGGYAELTLGNLDDVNVQGALNIPIVPDKVLLRLSGYEQSRDGYTFNEYTHHWEDNQNQQGGRFSLTLKPTSSFENDTVFEYDYRNERVGNAVTFACNPMGTNNQIIPPQPNNVWYDECLADKALGPRKVDESLGGVFETGPNQDGMGIVENHTLSNITTWNVNSDIQLKNIFGWSLLSLSNSNNNGGTADTLVTSDPVVPWPHDPSAFSTLQRFTDEFQIHGKSFDNVLTWLVGAYVQNDQNPQPTHLFYNGAFGVIINIISQEDVSQYAGYADGTLDLSRWVHGLTLSGGVRQTSVSNSSLTTNNSNVCEYYGLSPTRPTCFDPSTGVVGLNAGLFRTETTSSDLTYSVSADEAVTNHLHIYATNRTGFQPGGVAPFDVDPRFKVIKPETVNDWEIGLKTDFTVGDAPVRLDVAAFHDDYDNKQQSEAGGAFNVDTVNAKSAVLQGFEAELDVIPVSWLSVSATWAYTDAHFTNFIDLAPTPEFPAVNLTSQPFPYTPWDAGSLIATVTLPVPDELGKMNVSMTYFYRSKTYLATLGDTGFQPQEFQPAYSLVNLQYQWNHIFGHPIDLTVWVENLTDQVYIDGASGETYGPNPGPNAGVDTVFYAPPRTFGATLRYTFGGG